MRRWLAACALGLAAGPAGAQFGSPGPATGSSPAVIPGGQVVSSTVNLNSAGAAIPKATMPAGTGIGSPLTKPYDPYRPQDVLKDSKIDPKLLVVPLSSFSTLPGDPPDLVDKLNEKLGAVTRFFRPTTTDPPKVYTPGLTRRNKERAAERMRRRD